MSHVNTDPILDIRAAVTNVLRAFGVPFDHKRLVDSVVDELPDFFRQELRGVDSESLIVDLTNMIDVGIRKSKYSTYNEWQTAVEDVVGVVNTESTDGATDAQANYADHA